MTTTFFVSDTHFGHVNILKYEPVNRPFPSIEEHDEELIRRWNAVVGPADIVWHLGDVVLPRKALQTLGRLNGRKRLVMGNHDTHRAADYLDHFEEILGCAYWGRHTVLTHVPIHGASLDRWLLNVHGHMHSRQVMDGAGAPDPRYCNVSVEQTDLAPLPADEVLARLKAVT